MRSKLKGGAGRVILRGASKRAYSFVMLERDGGLPDLGAVYIYARRVAPDSAHATAGHANGAGLDLGYIGRTANLAWQDGEHERLGHFVGHAFDVILVLPVDQEPIRADIEADLIQQHNPVLNDLLRSYQPGEVS